MSEDNALQSVVDTSDLDCMAVTASGYAPTQIAMHETALDGTPVVKVTGDLVVSDLDGSNEINVTEFIKSLQERLLVLQPDFEAHKEYPALKDAYDQYKMLEKLLLQGNKNDKKD